jgi:hypothetical protein
MEKIKRYSLILLSLIIVSSCTVNKSDREKNKLSDKEKKDQYRVGEFNIDNKSQLIDLIEGDATFDIIYEGNSSFLARILNSNGDIVDILIETNGQYKGIKTIKVPKTTSYILDVKTTGRWSVSKR